MRIPLVRSIVGVTGAALGDAGSIIRGPRVNKEHLVQYWLKLPLARADGDGVGMILCLDHFIPAVDDDEAGGRALGT